MPELNHISIPVVCRTNIDKFKLEDWPTMLVMPPQLGQTVRSKSGKELVIVQITHCAGRWNIPSWEPNSAYLEIELHTRDGSIPR